MSIYNKITINGTTYMDLSQDTVADASHIRSGYVGHLNDGTQVTGTYSGNDTSWETIVDTTVNINETDDGSCYYVSILNNYNDTINLNSVWRVTWNGSSYICTVNSSGDPDGDPYAIGNQSIVGVAGGNNEPFMIQRYWGETLLAFSTNSVVVHIILEKQIPVSGLISKTITENGTYNPADDNANGYSEVIVNVENEEPITEIIIPEQTITASSPYTQINFEKALVEGEEYLYTVNGTSQTRTAENVGSIILVVTASKVMFDYDRGSMYLDVLDSSLYGTYTIKVEKIISNGVSGGGDVYQDSEGYLVLNENGGIGEIWSTVTSQNITIASGSPNYFIINGYTLPFAENQKYRITWGNTQYVCDTWEGDNSIVYDGYGIGNPYLVDSNWPNTGEPFIIYRDSATRLVGVTNQAAGAEHITIEIMTGSLIQKIITSNGLYKAENDNADGYTNVLVRVLNGGLEYEEGTWTPANDISKPTITFANSHSEPPFFVVMSDITDTADSSSAYTQYAFSLVEWKTGLGNSVKSGSDQRYGAQMALRRSTGSSAPTAINNMFAEGFDSQLDTLATHARFWANENEFYPDDNNDITLWRAGRTYKWIAVWAPTT